MKISKCGKFLPFTTYLLFFFFYSFMENYRKLKRDSLRANRARCNSFTQKRLLPSEANWVLVDLGALLRMMFKIKPLEESHLTTPNSSGCP